MSRISARRLVIRGILIAAAIGLVAGAVRVAELRSTPLGQMKPVGALQPSTQWVGRWEHNVPLGGQAFGSLITTAYILNPADPVAGGATARVEITLYLGKCGSPTKWSSGVQTIAAGSIGSFSSYPPPAGMTFGFGCVYILSSLPVVPINGAITDTTANPATGSSTSSTKHMDFTPVAWNLGGAS
jgi:hypothetical protein